MIECSGAELELMELFWKQNHQLTSTEFYQLVEERWPGRWSKSTVSVFVTRLIQKGVLNYQRKGRISIYTPVSKVKYRQAMIERKVQDVFGSSFEALLASFLGKEEEGSLEEIREILKEYTNE